MFFLLSDVATDVVVVVWFFVFGCVVVVWFLVVLIVSFMLVLCKSGIIKISALFLNYLL